MRTAHVLLWQEHGVWHGYCLEADACGDGETAEACHRSLVSALRHKAHVAELDGSEIAAAPDWAHDFYAQERWERWFRGFAPAHLRSVTGYETLDWLVRDGGERTQADGGE